MDVTVGRTVLYTISQTDAEQINKRITYTPIRGNFVMEDQQMPMVVTRVFPNGFVNGQVLLDAEFSYWATTVPEGVGPHTWAWPKRD